MTLASEGGAHSSARSRSAASTARSAAFTALTQEVSYLGYHVKVPASWPVYRLSADPSRCVLFNRHAVYLGRPGADERCPSSAVGRTEALLVQPLGSQASLPPQTSVQRGNSVQMPSGKQAAQDAVSQTVRLALPKAGVEVTASYGHDPALIRSILRGAHLTSAGPAASSQAAPASAGPNRPGQAKPRRHPAHGAVRHGGSRHGSSRHGDSRHGDSRHGDSRHGHSRHGGSRHGDSRHGRRQAAARPSSSPLDATAAPSTITRAVGAGLGFDTCTVPSVATMKSWLASPFRTVGTYLGGDNWACNYGNFSRSWVTSVAALGWRFLPLWVGPQAPCTNASGVSTINTSDATGQGRSQAASAASTAAGFGIGKGSPIYFDMEGYDNLDSSCSRAVLSFLSGWTQGLHQAGYRSGVYSSASSGISDLAGQYHSGYSEPNDVWFAEWNADAVVSTGSLPRGDFPGYRRVHQFNGPNVEKYGGVSVDLDDDYVAGDVAGLASPPGPYALTQPDAVHVDPGSSSHTQLVIAAPAGGSAGQTVQWQVQQAKGVTVTPDQGSAVVAPGESVSIEIQVKASSSAPQRRDNLTVGVSSAGQALSGTTLLVSVARNSIPTPKPIVLYAAGPSSITEASELAHEMALPSGTVTGSFKTAWRDTAAGKSIVVAVGEDAVTALYRNPCGWSNPDHQGKGSTPFVDLGGPLIQPPGKIYFENAAGANPSQTAQLADALTKYALTGTVPSPHAMPVRPLMPGSSCHGVPSNP